MANPTISRIRDWGEPAHPAVVKLHEDLLNIYKRLKEFQTQIDQAFDQASRQIGYIVTTTLPVQMHTEKGGKFKEFSLAGEHLKDTIFDREISPVLKKVAGSSAIPTLTAGNFHFYLIWYEALKLKLRTDWMEPPHLRPGKQALAKQMLRTHWMEPAHPKTHWMEPAHVLQEINPKLNVKDIASIIWEAHEPAHWFDKGALIGVSEAVVIEAIDEVYPELRLVERISRYRGAEVELNPQPLPPVASE